MSNLLQNIKWKSATFAITATAATLTGSFILFHLYFKRNLTIGDKRRPKEEKASSSKDEQVFLPPLPDSIVSLLRASRLCFLATQCDGEPHLSLMNFTYHQQGEVIILCTRRNTKKFAQIMKNTKVAVLVHDFPHLNMPTADQDENHGKSWSITLNGLCKICPVGDSEGERLRSIHLVNNPDYSQFINGDDIAVVKIVIEKARMCDINDRVSYWNVKDGFTTSD